MQIVIGVESDGPQKYSTGSGNLIGFSANNKKKKRPRSKADEHCELRFR